MATVGLGFIFTSAGIKIVNRIGKRLKLIVFY